MDENSATVIGPSITKNNLAVVNRDSFEVARGENPIDLVVPKGSASGTPPARTPGGRR